MLFNTPNSDESATITNIQDAQGHFPNPLQIGKKNDFNILKSAYLLSKYAGAGARMRKLKEFKNRLALTG